MPFSLYAYLCLWYFSEGDIPILWYKFVPQYAWFILKTEIFAKNTIEQYSYRLVFFQIPGAHHFQYPIKVPPRYFWQQRTIVGESLHGWAYFSTAREFWYVLFEVERLHARVLDKGSSVWVPSKISHFAYWSDIWMHFDNYIVFVYCRSYISVIDFYFVEIFIEEKLFRSLHVFSVNIAFWLLHLDFIFLVTVPVTP